MRLIFLVDANLSETRTGQHDRRLAGKGKAGALSFKLAAEQEEEETKDGH